MSDRPPIPPSGDDARFEQRVRETVRHVAYPPTPDIARSVRVRLRESRSHSARLAAAAAVVVVLLAALWGVPEVRAEILRILRIGAVTVMIADETPTPFPTLDPTATRDPDAPLRSALELPGETTLNEARERLGDGFRLPAYPPDLGTPDRVFMNEYITPIATLVWVAPDNAQTVELVLTIVHNRGSAFKYEPHRFEEIEVNGHIALWFDDPHLLAFYGDRAVVDGSLTRQIDMHVLLWEQDSYTYRLETTLPMDEAVRIAESLQ